MSFPLGKPILILIVIAAISGAGIWLRKSPQRGDLEVATFSDPGFRTYGPLVKLYSDRSGMRIGLNLVQNRALQVRLTSAFLSGGGEEQLPDLVEIEISEIGKFFRPPVDQVGFVDLTDRIKASGLYDRLIRTRFAPWSKEGHIFGVPSDVHPVAIAYREDLFREAGIDLSEYKTWPAFHQACIRFRDYWRAKGYPHRHAIELDPSRADAVIVMLLQRGINPIDDFNRIHLNDPKVAETVAFYAKMVAGKDKVSGETSGGDGGFSRDLAAGSLCAFIAPDWRTAIVRRNTPDVSGKMRLMPLPVFDPTDAPTATWGGTMMGIPKTCKNPDAAWELLQFLYFSDEALASRRAQKASLPAIRSEWMNEAYHQPDDFFGGQKASELYVELAEKLPARYVTPVTTMANATLAYVVNLAVAHVNRHGTDGLEEKCQEWLDAAAADLDMRMRHWSVEE